MAKARAANVSIIKLIQSIWVMVSGERSPTKAPNSTTRQAATLIVSCASMKRWIFW